MSQGGGAKPDQADTVVLVHAPSADIEFVREAAIRADVQLRFVRDGAELAGAVAKGAGAALLCDTSLASGLDDLRDVLDSQARWSELPIIALFSETDNEVHAALDAIEELQRHVRVKLVLLHRPVPTLSLASALRSAVKSRRRQYEVRDLLARLNKDVRLRDQYLAMLGHELRNPLNSIGHVAEIFSMAGDALSTEQRRWGADVIGRQLRHLSRLLDQLLDVARVQRGKIKLEAETVDLRAVAWRCLETLDVGAGRGLVMCLPKEPVLVRGDPLRLAQIIDSLLDNARKYTGEGGTIRFAVRREREAIVTVADDGRGIKSSVLPYVFEPFFQDPSPRADGSRGLGLGLAMAENLTQLHGGRISVRSAGSGHGAEFEVRLPL